MSSKQRQRTESNNIFTKVYRNTVNINSQCILTTAHKATRKPSPEVTSTILSQWTWQATNWLAVTYLQIQIQVLFLAQYHYHLHLTTLHHDWFFRASINELHPQPKKEHFSSCERETLWPMTFELEGSTWTSLPNSFCSKVIVWTHRKTDTHTSPRLTATPAPLWSHSGL